MCVCLGRATQNGVFECAEGVPWTCDAECAIEFGPYWETCMLQSGLGGTGDMEGFAGLYDTCKNLPPGENAVLMHTVNDMINDPWCRINTTGIISVSTLALTAFFHHRSLADEEASLSSGVADRSSECAVLARRVGLLRTDDRERSIYVRGGLLLDVRSGACVRPLVQPAVCRPGRRARGGSIRGTGSAGLRDGLVPHV